jgi:hypothetical protein
MTKVRLPLLRRLLKRLVLSVFLTLIGFLGLIVPRLNLFQARFPELIPGEFSQYLDAGALSLAVLGFLCFLYYTRSMSWRLRRIDDLGESRW